MSEFTQEQRITGDDRPLNDQEYQLLQRIMSDPFSLPLAFKTWLVSYLETSDLTIPISSVQGLKDILGVAGVGGGTLGIFPAGTILPYAVSTPPAGSLACDGASYPKATYKRLSDAIGVSFGGDATNFNVPDLRGRFPVGRGTAGTVANLGNHEGLAVGSRQPQHGHTASVADTHQHRTISGYEFMLLSASGGSASGFASPGSRSGAQTTTDTASTTGAISVSVGGGLTQNNTPAYLTISFIIVY